MGYHPGPWVHAACLPYRRKRVDIDGGWAWVLSGGLHLSNVRLPLLIFLLISSTTRCWFQTVFFVLARLVVFAHPQETFVRLEEIIKSTVTKMSTADPFVQGDNVPECITSCLSKAVASVNCSSTQSCWCTGNNEQGIKDGLTTCYKEKPSACPENLFNSTPHSSSQLGPYMLTDCFE